MAYSSDSVSIDVDSVYLGGKEYNVKTGHGSLSVVVYGDQDKPGLVTYPDLALNHTSCFQRLFLLSEAASLLLHNFCIYHVTPPGHEFLQLGAVPMCPSDPVQSAENLADQILEVLNFFRLDTVMCMGVSSGAYILSLFAVKHRERVIGLILVSPLCKSPSWTEWLYNKVMSNLLYFYGTCGLLKECLLKRYFSEELRGTDEIPESEVVQACRRCLDEKQSTNVMQFLQAMNGRPDISEGLKKLRCRTLIFVGDESPFYNEAIHMMSKMDKRCSALVEVQACGSLVTQEQPYAMLIPLEYFLMGFGFYRPLQISGSPRSPLCPTCISPELLSPESMGLKLKPIKTRVSLEV